MVNIPTGLAINTATAGDRTIPATFRKIMATLFKQSQPGIPVPGIIPGPADGSGNTPLSVTGDPTGMNYLVWGGFAVTSRTGQGAYIVGTTDDLTVPTTAADGSHGRIDLIYIVQPDPELSETGHAKVDVAVGTPSATPAEPTGLLPTGALVLAKKLIAAGATNTNDGAAFYGQPSSSGLSVDWSTITNVPSSFPPSAHSGALVTSGTIPSGVTFAGNVTGTIGGHKITISQSQPGSPTTGDVWISW